MCDSEGSIGAHARAYTHKFPHKFIFHSFSLLCSVYSYYGLIEFLEICDLNLLNNISSSDLLATECSFVNILTDCMFQPS